MSKKGSNPPPPRFDTTSVSFQFGDLLKDKITGLEGVVVVRAKYSTGCTHYGVCPTELKDGKELNWVWLDESRWVLKKKNYVNFNTEEPTGGPCPAGPKG